MNLKDFHRFRTALEITATSNHDGEVLAAIRLANRLLKADGQTWTKLLQGKTAVPAADDSAYASFAEDAGDDIADMIAHLEKRIPRSNPFFNWVISIREYYERHDGLTDGQLAALRRAYANNQEGQPNNHGRRR
jgi:hypothetical protein